VGKLECLRHQRLMNLGVLRKAFIRKLLKNLLLVDEVQYNM